MTNSMAPELTLDQVDLLDQDLFAEREPWDVFALLRREAPVYWHPAPRRARASGA